MKILIVTILLTFVFCFYANAQSDTLVITLKNNQTEKVPISQIQKIQFENITGVDEPNNVIASFITNGNYPNPFREQTNIEFEIASQGRVVIIIYDNTGKQIQTLNCDNCPIGRNTLQWNCRDNNNKPVQSGVYYYEVHFRSLVLSKKMIMVK